jgi:hypothetical protein
MVADRMPTTAGVNATVNVQLPPGVSEAPHVVATTPNSVALLLAIP